MKHWEGWVVLAVVLLILAYAVSADETELSRPPATDSAVAIFLTPKEADVDMRSMLIKVPHIVGGTVIACFKMPTQHETDCFYSNDETGEVVLKKVLTNEEET